MPCSEERGQLFGSSVVDNDREERRSLPRDMDDDRPTLAEAEWETGGLHRCGQCEACWAWGVRL